MKTVFHNSETRGHTNFGWLNSYHSFSFGDYYDPERIHFGALRVLNDDTVKAEYNLHLETNGVYAFVLNGNLSIEGQKLSARDGFGIFETKEINILAEKETEFLLMEVPMKL